MDRQHTGFSPSGYRALLREFADAGYVCGSFDAVEADTGLLLLRHDVDYNPHLACQLGAIAAEEGCKATFFVLLATEFYNLFTRAGREALRELQQQGHDIGLHFDRSVYDADEAGLEAAAAQECTALEELLGQPVKVTAFHRPAVTPEVLGRTGLFAGRPHAYDPRFFTDMAYVSDSAGYWAYGHPCDHPAFAAGTAMQVTMHPYLWCADESASAFEKIERVRREREAFLVSEYRRNLRYYPR